MNIGELAKRTGLTSSRIRFYESAGLLTAVERRPNGYRTYSTDAVIILELITTAQKAGFTLDEIRTLLPSGRAGWQHDKLIDALRRKVTDIEALEARLQDSKAQLIGLIKDIEAKPDDINCAENARRVLSRVLGKDIGEATMTTGDGKLVGKTQGRRSARAS